MLVLLMLTLGSLMLQGMSLRHQAKVSQATLDKSAIRESANAESLLEWGRFLSWATQSGDRCQSSTEFSGRACLRVFADDTALLIANSGEQFRWQTGKVSGGKVRFDNNGWSDFCPRKEVSQCQIP
ncbi:DUF2509 family protein [Enterobacter sp. CC120223-11]|uniref:DUF2509 family protein n=1 Tax=Enterobacter sp. CC120223-11 TaxID=1378073 RepID=UPI000BCEB3DB|nr:DUF2509 family protein [Enterobacter sp. CC120223-11]SNY64885.1 Protein of unknown function [Enterobacter sp. CC120223-11]